MALFATNLNALNVEENIDTQKNFLSSDFCSRIFLFKDSELAEDFYAEASD